MQNKMVVVEPLRKEKVPGVQDTRSSIVNNINFIKQNAQHRRLLV